MAPRSRAYETDELPRRSSRLASIHSMAATNGVSRPKTSRKRQHLDIPEDSFRKVITTPPVDREPDVERWQEDLDNEDYNRAFSQGDSFDAISDTQAFSQGGASQRVNSQYDEDFEKEEEVWGYLTPYYTNHGGSRIVLRRNMPKPTPEQRAWGFTLKSASKVTPGKFTIGRRKQEVDLFIDNPALSNRHCMLYIENGDLGQVILEDLSTNGTFVNDQIVGKNHRRVLQNGDTIDLCRQAAFSFHFPRYRTVTSRFRRDYVMDKFLGQGQFGRVFLAFERSTGVQYAVKMVDFDPTDPRRLEVLRQEESMLLAVDHPNCIMMKDIFHEPEGVYMVLEYASGGELFNYIINKGALSEIQAKALFKQLFLGIQHLHERNMIHRDLKPENILLWRDNLDVVKICDFGLVKVVGEDSFTTTLCGTPAYVAPEVLNRHRQYNKAVDIWSLGVILFVSLCGYPPFSDELYSPEFPWNMRDQIIRGLYHFDSPYWDHITDDACDLIQRMLQVDPVQRATIEECLTHSWIRTVVNPADSTGLAGPMSQLGVQRRRGPGRTRTLFRDQFDEARGFGASIAPPRKAPPVKRHEPRPADNRRPEEFIALGGQGDPALYDQPCGAMEEPRDIASQRDRDRDRQRRDRERDREVREREVDSVRDPYRQRRSAGRRERDRADRRERERERERDQDRKRDSNRSRRR